MSSTGLSVNASVGPARVAAVLTLFLGVVSLAGWILGADTFTSLIPGAVQMKANTALAILLCGTALLILNYRASATLEGVARAMATLAAGIGLATVSEYLFGWQLGIDELLLKDGSATFGGIHGRMSPFSASAFIVLGFAVASLRVRVLDRASRIAACLGLAIGLVSLLGSLWNAGEMAADRWLPPIAVNTAVCLIVIAIGVLWTRRGSAAVDSPKRIALASVELRILAGFAAAISLLALGAGFTYKSGQELAASMQWIAHTQEVRTELADIFGSLAAADVVARDYLGTGEPARFEEYQRLVAGEHAHLSNLSALVADNAAQLDNAVQLGTLVQKELTLLDQGMTAFKAYGIPAARAVLSESRSENTISHVGAATARMDNLEKELMRSREAKAAGVRQTTLSSLLLTLAAAIGLFIVLFRGVHSEMLARRAAEQALRDSDQYNRSIIESSPDCVSVLTTGAHITQMTPQGLKLMGIDRFGAIEGTDWCSFWSGDDQTAARNAIAAACNGLPGRFSGVTERGGTKQWWDVIVMPILGAGGQAARLLAVARDISEVKRSESNLVVANRFLDSLIDSLPVMVVVTDAKTLRFVRVNRLFEQTMGVAAGDMVGKTVYDLLPLEEADLTRRTDQEALASGRLIDISERNVITKAGVRVLNTKKVPIYDESGAVHYLLSISTDITASKLSEQAIRELNAQLEAKAVQMQSSNKELESFSYSVSHDLRAPLRAIDGFAEIIQEEYGAKLDHEARRYLSVIRDNSKRMGSLIDDLLEFSRLGRQAVTKVEINVELLVREVVDEVLHTESLRAGGKAAPRIDVGVLPEIFGDRSLLRQTWTNLISNAVKYSSKSPHPHIEIGGSAGDNENRYFVRDNGVGFSMSYVEKLFGVFQRLHRADEFPGTGVGLAIVQRVVTRHGGRVWAEGKVNAGATFSFALPRGK
jgi:PAS domain S-box-containing protein